MNAARWTPVGESLPDAELTVLVATGEDEDGPVWLGFFDGEEWRHIDGYLITVTHWMDLPEPPEADPVLSDDLCDAYGVPRGSRRSEVQDDGPGPECTGRMRWVELGAAPFALTETSAACVRPADGVMASDPDCCPDCGDPECPGCDGWLQWRDGKWTYEHNTIYIVQDAPKDVVVRIALYAAHGVPASDHQTKAGDTP